MDFNYITGHEELTPLLNEIRFTSPGSYIGFDTETGGTDARLSKLRLTQFAINGSIYVLNMEQLGMKYLKYITELLVDKNCVFIIQNSKFDIKFIYHNTGILLNSIFDPMIAESIITGCDVIYVSLADLLKKHLDIEIDKDIRKLFLDSDITNEMVIYSALDVKYLFQLMEKQMAEIEKLNLTDVLELEMRVVSPTAKMEWDGIYLDKDLWTNLFEISESKIKETGITIKDYIWNNIKGVEFSNAYELAIKFNIRITTKKLKNALEQVTDISYIKEWWYDNFNINSRLQVMKALSYLGINIDNFQKKTLESLKDKHEIINYILDNKAWAKKLSTYGIDYLKHIHPITGRIHAEYNQNGTKSGRYSCSSPNLQQVPNDVIDGRCLWRECFLSTGDNIFLASDYSQQEYRIVGQITGEDRIINAYLNDIDLHANTASIIYNTNVENITKEQRFEGKTINFGLLYGMSKWGLARSLGITVNDADVLMNKVLAGMPKFTYFKKKVDETVLNNMYSRTMLGRIRFFERRIIFDDHIDLNKYNARIKREGFNHIIQGTAADMIKLAFAYVAERNPFSELFKVLLLIHDEILAEVHNSIKYEAKKFLESCMEDAFYYFVPDIPTKIEAKLINAWSK